MIARADITGLVLAGGAGTRMGGIDKGLVTFRGVALAEHAARRLGAQVAEVLISANRSHERYRRFGFALVADPVLDDCAPAVQGFAGPLAGILAGLRSCPTPWLAVVPCDAPCFPADLVARLAAAAPADIGAAYASTTGIDGEAMKQPTFCLLRCAAAAALERALRGGERKAGRWLATMGASPVAFADARAFANANDEGELRALEADAC